MCPFNGCYSFQISFARTYLPALLPQLHGKVLYIDTDCIVQGTFLELSYYALIRAGGVAGMEADRPILYWDWLGLAVSVELFLFYSKIAPETISGGVKFLVVGGSPTRCTSHTCILPTAPTLFNLSVPRVAS